MEQISLNIIPKLQYSLGNFLLHAGVKEAFLALQDISVPSNGRGFASAFVLAPERYGKTHLSMALTEWAATQSLAVQVVSGFDIPALCYEIDAKLAAIPNVLIIDDVQSYLLSVEPGGSGQFVSLFEWCKRNSVSLILLSSEPHQKFPCDAHIMSRVKSMAQLEIAPPGEDDVPGIIEVLAKQRGFKLQPRSVEFIRRRLGRDLGSLERYIDRLIHLAQVLGRSITLRSGLIGDAL
jgi:chromosomal replication initiation ATPase DnaA